MMVMENDNIGMEDKNIDHAPPVDTPIRIENSCQDKFMRKLTAAIRQVGDVVDYETQALGAHTNPDFNDIKARKARGLHVLTQLFSDGERAELDETCGQEIQFWLDQLQVKLTRNQELLQIHMEAVNELVEMIHAAAHAQETDGTYDPYLYAKQTDKGQPQ